MQGRFQNQKPIGYLEDNQKTPLIKWSFFKPKLQKPKIKKTFKRRLQKKH